MSSLPSSYEKNDNPFSQSISRSIEYDESQDDSGGLDINRQIQKRPAVGFFKPLKQLIQPNQGERDSKDDSIDLADESSDDSSSESAVSKGNENNDEGALVPLRKRANSDLHNYPKDRSDSSRHTRDDRETPERWRNRLWPGKAIIAYCRIITRCRPPESTPGVKLKLNKDQIKAHWRENEMNKVGTYFENVMMHSATFFLLTVEESRAAVTNSDEGDKSIGYHFDENGNPTDDRVNYDTIGNNGWLDCEIMR
jgi:hypothetical protein